MKENKEVKPLDVKLMDISMSLISVERDVKGKDYNYASLPAIRKALKVPLADKGIGYRFSPFSTDSSGVTLRLTIINLEDLDDQRDISMFIPSIIGVNDNIFHTVGSGLTYYKKYMLSTIFNLDIENDSDAEIKQLKKIIVLPNSKEHKAILNLVKNGASIDEVKERYTLPPELEKLLIDSTYSNK